MFATASAPLSDSVCSSLRQAVEHIDLNRKGLFTRVTACHIGIYYYMGFSYAFHHAALRYEHSSL